MGVIKNLHRLDLIISDQDKEKLDAGAALHKRHSNITFKILDVTDKSITVRVTQEKPFSENVADKKTLVDRTRELFERFLPGRKVHPQAVPYEPDPVSKVDANWIKSTMDKNGIRVTDLVEDTGIDKTNISAWLNGVRPMSQPVKAMFFYYIKAKGLSKAKKL